MQWEEKDNWPTVRMYNPIWKGPDDVHIPAGFLDHPDNKTITGAIEILKRELGDEVAVIGKTMGPWTLAYHMFGVESFPSYDRGRPRYGHALPPRPQGDLGPVR